MRDTSLVDNLDEADRLSSTVAAAWSGTDPDGYVDRYELRFYTDTQAPVDPEAGWTATMRQDSLVLLPIPRGERAANVVFEVRAVDNDGAVDPTPARTVFPIQNAPPTIRLSRFELPPDTTFPVISFAWDADDPEGLDNLDRIEVSLNDSTRFVPLTPDVDFITLVGQDLDATETPAEVFLGLGFQRTNLTLPGLRLDAENTFYVRAVDRTDTTSVLSRHTWYVKPVESNVLYVNDFRKTSAPTVQAFHLDLLRSHLPEGTPIDVWDISLPVSSGSAGDAQRSDALPPVAVPTLRQTLALYDYIYWVSSNATNSNIRNNLPLAASVMDLFFEEGGKLMVHTPVALPSDPEENFNNPAILLLPMNDLIAFPDSLLPILRMPVGSDVAPVQPVPGLGQPLPALEADQFITGTLPYEVAGSSAVPLLEGSFQYRTRRGGQGDWFGPATVASLSQDRRIGLFALPVVNEQTGAPTLVGVDGDPDAGSEAVRLMLESLGFPSR